MRYLIYFLLLANLVYFGWYQYAPRQKPAELATASIPISNHRLVLLSERPVTEPPVEPPEVEAAAKAPAEPVTQPAVVAMETHTVEYKEQADENDVSVREADIAPEVVNVAPEPACYTVGPVHDKGDVAEISEKLSQHDFQLQVRGGKMREPAGYWVYMPAMPADKARSIVADLDARGMKDYFIGRKNHISLGIFSTEKKARKRLKRVKELGYSAELGQRYRNRVVHWLDVEGAGLRLPSLPVWEEIRKQHMEVRVEQVKCTSPDH